MTYVFASLDEAFNDPYHDLVKTQSQKQPSLGVQATQFQQIPSPESNLTQSSLPRGAPAPPPRPYPDAQPSVEYDAVMSAPTQTIHVPSQAQPSQTSIRQSAPVQQPDYRPSLATSIGAFMPPTPFERDQSRLPLASNPINLPDSLYSPQGKKPVNMGGATLIRDLPLSATTQEGTIMEGFANQSFPMPTSREEWEELLQQLEAFGKKQGWTRRSQSMEWQVWLQDMIPYILLGVFVVFVLEGAVRLGANMKKK
jgi:hypothetical protein